MLQTIFHAWERRLASVTKDRVVRPFEWGLDWVPRNGHPPDAPPPHVIGAWVSDVMRDSDAFFTPPPTDAYTLGSVTGGHTGPPLHAGGHTGPPLHAGGRTDAPRHTGDGERELTFPSAFETPHPANNTVHCRYFPARASQRSGHRAAVLVMPQWNADAGGHVGLCRLLAWSGMSALRLSLPYHDRRMPPELHRADFIVSANVARTLQVCRQAVLDARRAIAWLHRQGYDRIGVLGTSLGSCLALLTTAHEPLVRAEALNHISPYFADVVWRGISTRHVREGLDGHIELDVLRALWKPISPRWFLERLRDRRTLLVYARYDLSFPVDLSEDLVREFRELGIPHETAVLRCGHYSTGKAPFKFVDGWILTRFLKKALLLDTGNQDV